MESMSDEFYIRREGGREGPFDLSTLEARARSGSLRPDDEVWVGAEGLWKKAEDLDELMEIFWEREDLEAEVDPESVEPLRPEPSLSGGAIFLLAAVACAGFGAWYAFSPKPSPPPPAPEAPASSVEAFDTIAADLQPDPLTSPSGLDEPLLGDTKSR